MLATDSEPSFFFKDKEGKRRGLLDCKLDARSFEAVKCIPGGSQPS